jgi:putative spermidine/putrescine transport system substrate-binding protein
MNETPTFQEDLADLACGLLREGRISRRQFLTGMAAVGLMPSLLGSSEAMAQAKEVIVCNWGGDAIKFMGVAWGEPFTKKTGVKVSFNGNGVTDGKIRAMVEANAAAWDVGDGDVSKAIGWGKQGLLETFDYTIVDRNKVPPGMAADHGIANYFYSFILGFDRSVWRDKPPRNWVDFFNVKDFPGMRAMRKGVYGQIEIALMGAGVPKNEIYPITPEKEKLAFETIRKLKPNTIFWAAGGDSQQLMRQKEVVMGVFFNTRHKIVHNESKGEWDWTWNQGIVSPGGWVVPKGNPAGAAVWPFIAFTQEPAGQVQLFELFSNAPANPQAAALVPAALKRFNASDPENYALQLPTDEAWYADNFSRVNANFLDLISS